MKKKLDIGNITNELQGASLFFTKPATPPPPQETEKNVTEKEANPLADSPFFEKPPTPLSQYQINENKYKNVSFDRSNERTMERTNVLAKQNRVKIRHTFDVYQDQLIALQGIQFEKVQAGKRKPKLGKMVSDGIDMYLKQWAAKRRQG
jgi:hypothetical protein